MVLILLIVLVKESGNTVHLIAKMSQESTTNTNTQPTTQAQQQQGQQPSQQQNQQQNNPFLPQNQSTQPNMNPFGNILRGMGLGGPQGATMTFTNVNNVNDLNQSLGGILGSLGIRLPPQQGNVQAPQTQPRTQTTQSTTHSNPFQTPPANTNRQNQQGNQPTSAFTSNLP